MWEQKINIYFNLVSFIFEVIVIQMCSYSSPSILATFISQFTHDWSLWLQLNLSFWSKLLFYDFFLIES